MKPSKVEEYGGDNKFTVGRRAWQKRGFKTTKVGDVVFILGYRTVYQRSAYANLKNGYKPRVKAYRADFFDTRKKKECSFGIYFSQTRRFAQSYLEGYVNKNTLCTVSLLKESLYPMYPIKQYVDKARAKRIWVGETHEQALDNAKKDLGL